MPLPKHTPIKIYILSGGRDSTGDAPDLIATFDDLTVGDTTLEAYYAINEMLLQGGEYRLPKRDAVYFYYNNGLCTDSDGGDHGTGLIFTEDTNSLQTLSGVTFRRSNPESDEFWVYSIYDEHDNDFDDEGSKKESSGEEEEDDEEEEEEDNSEQERLWAAEQVKGTAHRHLQIKYREYIEKGTLYEQYDEENFSDEEQE